MEGFGVVGGNPSVYFFAKMPSGSKYNQDPYPAMEAPALPVYHQKNPQ